MKIKNPTHPGQILKQDVLAERGLSIAEAAAAVQVSRSTLSRLLSGRAAVSANMARRLGQWLGTGAEVWLRMQAVHDQWLAGGTTRPRMATLHCDAGGARAIIKAALHPVADYKRGQSPIRRKPAAPGGSPAQPKSGRRRQRV